MDFIVIGCGRIGAELAYRLFQKGHKVTVVDQDPEAFHNLPDDFRGRIVEGDAMSREILHRAGIETAGGLAAVTPSDTLNAVLGYTAGKIYGIQNVIVRNFDPRWRPMQEAFGLHLISSSSWGAQRMEEMLYNTEIHTVFSAGNGEVEIYEFTVTEKMSNKLLGEMVGSEQCIAVGLTRAGKALLPRANTRLEVSDLLLVSATFEGITALRERLNASEEA